MAMGRVHQLGVDLVADHGEVVTGGDLGDMCQLRRREHVTGGVVRMAQQQHAGRLGGEARLELVVVEPPAAADALRRHFDDSASGALDRAEERWIRRGVHDDPVAGPGEVVDRGDDALHHVGQLAEPIDVRLPAEPHGHPFGEALR